MASRRRRRRARTPSRGHYRPARRRPVGTRPRPTGRDQSQRPLRCPRAKAQRRRDPAGLLLDVVQLPPRQSRRRRDGPTNLLDDVEPARRRRRDRSTGSAQSLCTPLNGDSRRLAMPRRRRRAGSTSSNPSRSASRRRREHLDVVLLASNGVGGSISTAVEMATLY